MVREMRFIIEELGELRGVERTAARRIIVDLNVGKQVSLGKVREEGVSFGTCSERVVVSVEEQVKNVIENFWG